jgi:hypothetical protein
MEPGNTARKIQKSPAQAAGLFVKMGLKRD